MDLLSVIKMIYFIYKIFQYNFAGGIMIKREIYMEKIRPFIDTDLIKVLTGIRRSGKSIMLELIKLELLEQKIDSTQFIHYNFEDIRHENLCDYHILHQEISKKLKKMKKKAYLFLDEIQEVNQWEKCINSLRVEFDCDIYITGSNSNLLSGELATYLAGRYVEFHLYPFSFCEFLENYRNFYKESDLKQAFQKYLIFGGMPYLGNLRYQEQPCLQYLKDIYSSVVLKDIVSRHSIRDIDLLQRILYYLIANIGMNFSANSISKFFKSEKRNIAPETVLNYIRYFESACLIYKLQRQDLKGKKLLEINEKYFMADHGLREALYGNNERDINQVLENIVFLEAMRRGYQVFVGKIAEKEIDFICEKKGEKIYIQVSYLLASKETIEREFGVYEQVEDHFPKYVLSLDEMNFSQNGIKHYNLIDFLLMKTW